MDRQVDINAALGMTTSERPLQVGDWVECVNHSNLVGLVGDDWPRQIKAVYGVYVSFKSEGEGIGWYPDRFRRVDPPKRDEVVELREQLADVTRERDEAQREVNELAELLLQAKNQLATVQAEAAAMRRIMAENESRLNDLIRRTGSCVDTGWITHELRHVLQEYNGTAGRELLDELRRRDVEIESLKGRQEHLVAAGVRHKRKAHNAKLAYVETLRGKIDPAWFGEHVEYWRYKNMDAYIFRTINGRTESKQEGGVWVFVGTKPEWFLSKFNDICERCDENGKRLRDGGAK